MPNSSRAQSPPGPPGRCGLCGGEGAPYRRKNGFAIQLCSRCGNAFVPRDEVPTDLEQLYSKAYFEGEQATGYPGYLRDRELLLRNFRVRLGWIERSRPPGKRVLDVGAAYGLFLKVAREEGWQASGVEIAPDCALEAAELSGASVACGDFLDVPLQGPYDVITMFDVIEHFRDPVACMKRAHGLLAPGGLLVLETGDIATPYARLLGDRWHFLDPPQHLFYFSLDGMKRVLRDAGFTAFDVHRPGRRVSLTNIAFKLSAAAPPGRLRDALTQVSHVDLPLWVYLNLADGIFVAARKP